MGLSKESKSGSDHKTLHRRSDDDDRRVAYHLRCPTKLCPPRASLLSKYPSQENYNKSSDSPQSFYYMLRRLEAQHRSEPISISGRVIEDTLVAFTYDSAMSALV